MKPDELMKMLKESEYKEPDSEITPSPSNLLAFPEEFIAGLFTKNIRMNYRQVYTAYCAELAKDYDEFDSEMWKSAVIVLKHEHENPNEELLRVWGRIAKKELLDFFVGWDAKKDEEVVDYLKQNGIETSVNSGQNWVRKYYRLQHVMLCNAVINMAKDGTLRREGNDYVLATGSLEEKLGIKVN